MAKKYKLVLFKKGLCPEEGDEDKGEVIVFEAGSIEEARAEAKKAYMNVGGFNRTWDHAFLVTASQEAPTEDWNEEARKAEEEASKKWREERDKREYERLKAKFGQ